METTATDVDLVGKASAHVYNLFKERLPGHLLYHTYQHTVEVANGAVKIGRKEGLDEDQLQVLALAAWFHDAGFVEQYDGHEEASARIASAFLEGEDAPVRLRDDVATLIRSTAAEHEPQNAMEGILHDADIAHAGKKKKFFRYSARLRKEWEQQYDRVYDDLEWAEQQLEFLRSVRFYTDYAQKKWGDKKERNIRKVQEQLGELLNEPKPIPTAGTDQGSPSRGVETMFRSAYRTHINLSAIADSKANIMISINAILMSIIVSFVSARIQSDPALLIPAAAMLLTSLSAVVFAILSARPKVTSEVFSLKDVRKNRANILFFGNFINMPLEEFKIGMREIMDDYDMLYGSMIHDLYSLGHVLQRKYRLLWLSYTVFMAGLVLTVVLFILTFFLGTIS